MKEVVGDYSHQSIDDIKDSLNDSEAKEQLSTDDNDTLSVDKKDPLLLEEENAKHLHSTEKQSIIKQSNGDCNENMKSNKGAEVSFSSGSLSRRDFLSSPSASRNFALGSLDIIMEKQNTEADCQKYGSDLYERPQKWGWAVVIASWIVMIPIAGVLASFGTIVTPLTTEFNATRLEAGWIGSLAFSFTVGTCPFSTPLFTVFGARKVAFVGVIGATISLFVTSFAPVLYLLFLTYSFLLGVFANFVYNTAMNLTGQYFPNKHQALATCLASAGVSFGTLLVNPLSKTLVEIVGWRHSLKIMSGLIFVVGMSCVAVFRPVKTKEQKIKTKLRHHQKKKGHKNEPLEEAVLHTVGSVNGVDLEAITDSKQHMQMESRVSLAAQEIKKSVFSMKAFDCSVCGNPAFILWMLGTFFWSVSFLFPFIFLIEYMSTIGIPGPMSAWVMTAYGISEFIGRLICAFGAARIRFSLAYVYSFSCAFVGLATILAPFGQSLAIMYTYAIAAGISAGILNSLMYVATMQFFGNDTGKHVWGYINVMLAAGMVVGPVVAGAIYDATKSYQAAFYMGGSVFIFSGLLMAFIPYTLKQALKNESEVEKSLAVPTSKHPKSPRSVANGKAGALRRLAHQQSALRGKMPQKSKWNGEVQSHLRELNEIEEELHGNNNLRKNLIV